MSASSGAIEYHAQLARDWEAKYAARRSFRARHKIVAALLAEAVRPGQRWLDAGCGTGHFSRQLAALGAHVIGIDGADSMVAAARSLGRIAGGELSYRTSSELAQLPEADGWFDGVLCSSVVEYLEEPERALAEFGRVTRRGGALVVSLPNARALIRRLHTVQFALTKALRREPTPRYWTHMRRMWTSTEAAAFVSAAGFEPRSIRAGGLGLGPEWLEGRLVWGPLLFVSAARR